MSRRLRTVAFSLIPLCALLSAIEIAARIYYRHTAPLPLALVQLVRGAIAWRAARAPRDLEVSPPAFREDPVLGYRGVPGRQEKWIVVRRGGGERRLDWHVTVGEDGYRATSADPDRYRGLPELWLLGCSFTFGQAVNDEDTFAWRLQQRLPGCRVRNLGQNGFGTVHALLQLEEAVRTGGPLPAVAVLVYNPFQVERSTGAPSWLLHLVDNRPALERVSTYPRASLGPAGELTIEPVSLEATRWIGRPDPDPGTQLRIAGALLDRVKKLCDAHRIVPVLAFQTGTNEDPVVRHAMELRFTVVNCTVDLDEQDGQRYRCLPFDPHPNARAHARYAELLFPALRDALSSSATTAATARGKP